MLLLRAGMIRKLVSGVYGFMPLGWRIACVRSKDIVRQEMDAAGGQEIHMSASTAGRTLAGIRQMECLRPGTLEIKGQKWHESFASGPTHEEIFTDIVRNRHLLPISQLPMNLYQIQTKYRDEARPRFGLMRSQ